MNERYAILLDIKQGSCGGNNYCVTFFGTRDECEALCGTGHDDTLTAWEKSKWRAMTVKPCAMRDMRGRIDPGVLARMEPRP